MNYKYKTETSYIFSTKVKLSDIDKEVPIKASSSKKKELEEIDSYIHNRIVDRHQRIDEDNLKYVHKALTDSNYPIGELSSFTDEFKLTEINICGNADGTSFESHFFYDISSFDWAQQQRLVVMLDKGLDPIGLAFE